MTDLSLDRLVENLPKKILDLSLDRMVENLPKKILSISQLNAQNRLL